MFKLWCEWDIGQENCIFSSEGAAWNYFQRNLNLDEFGGEFFSHKQIFDEGLAGIEGVRVDP